MFNLTLYRKFLTYFLYSFDRCKIQTVLEDLEADIEVHVNDKAVLEQEMKRFENEKNEMALDLASVQQTKGQIKSE